jgi:hypothetical protein
MLISTRPQNGTYLRHTASFEKKSHKVVICHVCVGALLSNQWQWKFAQMLRVISTINHANFGGCMLRSLVSANGSIQEADMALTRLPCASTPAGDKSMGHNDWA